MIFKKCKNIQFRDLEKKLICLEMEGESGSSISTGKLNEEGIDKDNFVR